MKNINIEANCDNAPKKAFLKDFNIAFAECNVEFIVEHVSDDIVWKIFGDQKTEGKEAFRKLLNEMSGYTVESLTIHQIITHGKEASANGEIRMENGNTYAFCDVYEFVSAGKNIIRSMYSYILPAEFRKENGKEI